ncbi:MAG: SusC/RagA family TonB-linked outer membrane protein [Dysgonamonadaceae bacterium]|jgi:TonB-linked SusC/RagA family outer membrane protein|nr:SusC/RagA family TonB-linked outer membrane protein [Dysgonamonadaceae bacterium]
MMIQNQKIIAILFSAVLAFIPLSVVAQQEIDENSLEVENSTGSLVKVAFRTMEQQELLGGVSVVNFEDVQAKAYRPSWSYLYLESMVSGLGNGIWGMGDMLIVVDGIPRDAENVHPSEVEQITVLKGAAAIALYGSRAANGVVQITTKRGAVGDMRVSVRVNTGFHVPKSLPKYLGSAEYMELYNEARINDRMPVSFTEETIENYRSGVNPYRYPDLDLYGSDYLRKTYNRSEAIAEITGGNEYAKYYTSMGYYREGSMLKVGDTKNDNTNRMFVRGNVDMKLHRLVTANVDVSATFNNSSETNFFNGVDRDGNRIRTNYWERAANLRPHRISPLIPRDLVIIADEEDPLYGMLMASNVIGGKYFLGGTQLDPTNPIADAYAAGTGRYVSRQFQFNGGVNFDLQNIAEGLFFRGKYGVDYATTYRDAFSNFYSTYTPTWTPTDSISNLVQNGRDSRDGVQYVSEATYRLTTFISGQFDYTREFEGGHNIFAMLLANGWLRKFNGEYQAIQNANLGLQMSYNLKRKYYVDFSAAVPYSPKMAKGNRMAFSPTGTLGWRLTKENFMSNQKVFDDLMLTVSGGIIHTDIDIVGDGNEMGYFLYKPLIDISSTAGTWTWGGATSHQQSVISFLQAGNPDLRFIKRKEINAGLRGSLLDKTITFDVNYFNIRMDGGLVRPVTYPSYFTQVSQTSSFVPYINYDIDDRQGVDFSVNFNKKFNEVFFSLGVNGMFKADEAIKRSEIWNDDYQYRVGHRLNQIWGLECLGFFQDQAEIDDPLTPRQIWAPVPGDLKYKDQNGDGVIDGNDEVYLGSYNSNTVLGLNFTVKWKGFTFFALGTGYFGGLGLKNNSYYWSGLGDRKYSEVVRDRWTEDTKETATYPRLTTTNGDNSFRNSDFWLYKTDRFNLSLVQITYDIPVKSSILKDLSVYVGGYNLLTIAKEREYMEMAVGSAPNTRFYNLGLKATF